MKLTNDELKAKLEQLKNKKKERGEATRLQQQIKQLENENSVVNKILRLFGWEK